jgi:hypothetical protein
VTGALRRDHRDVDILRRLDRPVPDVEAMGEHQHVASFEVWRDVLLVDRWLRRVGRQDHDHVGFLRRFANGLHRKPGRLGLGLTLAAFLQADAHVHAALLQVERVGVPLGAVADDRHLLASNQREVGVFFIANLGHVSLYFSKRGLCG